MRDGKATLEQIEAALLNDNIARRDEALDAAYVQIENLRVLLSEAKALNTELRLYWIASENKAECLRVALTQFVACYDTVPPTSLMIEMGMACKVARRALLLERPKVFKRDMTKYTGPRPVQGLNTAGKGCCTRFTVSDMTKVGKSK